MGDRDVPSDGAYANLLRCLLALDGARPASAAREARKALADSGETSCSAWVSRRASRWVRIDPPAAAALLDALQPLVDSPAGVLAAILIGIRADPAAACGALLDAALRLAFNAPADEAALQNVVVFACGWITYTCTPSADLRHLMRAVRVLAVAAEGADDHASVGVGLMADELGNCSMKPRRPWRETLTEALSCPALATGEAAEAAEENDVSTEQLREAWEAAFLARGASGDASLWARVLCGQVVPVVGSPRHVEREDDTGHAEDPIAVVLFHALYAHEKGVTTAADAVVTCLECLQSALRVGGSAVPHHASLLLRCAALEAAAAPALRAQAHATLASAYPDSAAADAVLSVAAADHLIGTDGVLRSFVPRALLRFCATTVARTADTDSAFAETLWCAFLTALREAQHDTAALEDDMAALLGLIVTRASPAQRETLSSALIQSINAAGVAGIAEGCAGLWGQAVQLWHLMLLPTGSIPVAVAAEHARLAEDAEAAPPATAASAWKDSALTAAAPCIVPAHRITDAVETALHTLMGACRRCGGVAPSARQGQYDLLQSTAHLLWATSLPRCNAASDAAPLTDGVLLRTVLNADVPELGLLTHSIKARSAAPFDWAHGIEPLHYALHLLERYVERREQARALAHDAPQLTSDDCETALDALEASLYALEGVQEAAVENVLAAAPTGCDAARALVKACARGGHCVQTAVARLLQDEELPPPAPARSAAPAPVGLGRFSSIKAPLSPPPPDTPPPLEELRPDTWYPRLSSEVDRLSRASPAPLETLLRHPLARLARREGESVVLFTACHALRTAFATLSHVLQSEVCCASSPDTFRRYRLLRALLVLHTTLKGVCSSGSAQPTLSQTALDLATRLLPEEWRGSVNAVCAAWRLLQTREAVELAAALGAPAGAAVAEMAKWLTSSKVGPPQLAPTPLTTLARGPMASAGSPKPWDEVWFAGVVAQRAAACDDGSPLGIDPPEDPYATWVATVAAMSTVLFDVSNTPPAAEVLSFLTNVQGHPRAVVAQRAVLRATIEASPEKIQALVRCGEADAAVAVRRWLSAVLVGDGELRALCRDCLLCGLPAGVAASGQRCVGYLAACADLAAGGHEQPLLAAVVRVLKGAVDAPGETWALPSLLAVLEFVKAALGTAIRVDSKGWFTHAAASLAEALACLKFCHRTLRARGEGASKLSCASQVPLLADSAVTHPYEVGHGCATKHMERKGEFEMMHWYLCYTAYPSEQQGACGWCAEYLHRQKGYDVEYAGRIPAYCDTDGKAPDIAGAAPCAGGHGKLGLTPHEAADPFVLALFHPPPATARHAAVLPAGFALPRDAVADLADITALLSQAVRKAVPLASARLRDLDTEEGRKRRCGVFTPGDTWRAAPAAVASADKGIIGVGSVATVDAAIDARLEYDSLPHYQINLLQSRTLTRRAAAASLCGWVAVVDKSQCLIILDHAASFPRPTSARRSDSAADITVLSRVTLKFKVVGMSVHPLNGQYLAVHGVHDVQVCVVTGGEITTQITPQLALSSLASSTHVLHCAWLPHAHALLAVVTTKFVKVFDLSADLYCPVHHYVVVEGAGSDIAAAAFAQDPATPCTPTLFVLTANGHLYSQVVVEGDCVDGPVALADAVDLPTRVARGPAASLHYSPSMGLICVGYANTEAFVAGWDFAARALQQPLPLPGSLGTIQGWEECLDAPGVLVCIANDGAQVDVLAFDAALRKVSAEVFDFDGSGAHIEGLAVTRHRGGGAAAAPSSAAAVISPTERVGGLFGSGVGTMRSVVARSLLHATGLPASDSAASPAPPTKEGSVCVVVALDSGAVSSYPLALPRGASQGTLLSDAQVALLDAQRAAALTARPLPRGKPRRVGGGKAAPGRDDPPSKPEDAKEADTPSPSDALLHGKGLPRAPPFDVVPLRTLRAMNAFDARWGGAARSDFPSTVPLNVWEDLAPLGRWAWSITRGVGVSAEDKEKLADGSDSTSVLITPLRNLSRAASELGAGSPTRSAPGASPDTTPPLTPQHSLQGLRTPPSGQVSPQARSPGSGVTPSTLHLGCGVGETRPAARFVLQSSTDAVVCGIRLRLSCDAAGKPPKEEDGAASVSAAEDPVVVVRVGSQSQTLPGDTSARWVGFVLTQREAAKTTKLGVEVSIATTGAEVLLRQVELFTTASAATADRIPEGRPSLEDKEEGSVARRSRDPFSTATSTLDAILQNLVNGRGGSPASAVLSQRKKDAEPRETAPPPPSADDPPGTPSPITVHTVLHSALDSLRLCLVRNDAAEGQELGEEMRALLWTAVLGAARPFCGAAAEAAAEEALAALHVLFAASKHQVRGFRAARAATLVLLACQPQDAVELQQRELLLLAAGAAAVDHSAPCAALLASPARHDDRARLMTLVSAEIDAAPGRAAALPVPLEAYVSSLYLLALVGCMACDAAGDAPGTAGGVELVVRGAASPVAAVRGACVYAMRRVLADPTLPSRLCAALADSLVTVLPQVEALPAAQQAAHHTALLAVVARLAYAEEEAARDPAAVARVVTALVPATLVYDLSADGVGLSGDAYLRVRALGLIAGAGYSPPRLLLPASDERLPAERCAVSAMEALAAAVAAAPGARLWVQELGKALLSADAEALFGSPGADVANALLPAAPPVQEPSRPAPVEVASTSEGANVSHPPPPARELVTLAVEGYGVNGEDALSSGAASAESVLVAVLQVAVALFIRGELDDIDGWKAAVDAALRQRRLAPLHRDLEHVLGRLCGSAAAARRYRDTVGLERDFAAVERFFPGTDRIPVADALCLHTALQGLAETATRSPRQWLNFCKGRSSGDCGVAGSLAGWLVRKQVAPELAAHAFRLLTLLSPSDGCYEKDEGADHDEDHDYTPLWKEATAAFDIAFVQAAAKTYLVTGAAVDLASDAAVRGHPVADAPEEVVHFLRHGVGGTANGAVVVFHSLLALFPGAAQHGPKGAEAVLKVAQEMLPHMAAGARRMAAKEFARRVAAAAGRCVEGVLLHPRASLYSAVGQFLGGSSYAFEAGVATDAPAGFSECTFSSLSADVKYEAETIFVRLANPVHLKRVSLLLTDCRPSKHPRLVEVWHSDVFAKDARAVREEGFTWERLGTMAVGALSALSQASIDLPVAVTAHALKLQIAAFHDTNGVAETLTCPSCNQVVTDKHGQCTNCEYENAYQCRQCRNINHEQLDAFLCNECGWCRYGRVEWSFLCTVSAVPHVLRNEADRARAMQLLNEHNGAAHELSQQLAELTTNAAHLAARLQCGAEVATTSGTALPRPPRLGPKDKLQREAERIASKTEDTTDGVHPLVAALASVHSTAKETSSLLAKSLRTQTALRRLIHAYTVRGGTTSACAAGADDVGGHRPTKLAVEEEVLVLPTHFGQLVHLSVLCVTCLLGLAKDGADVVQDAVLSPDIVAVLYEAALHTPDAVRGAARDLLVTLQHGSRGVTERVTRSCGVLLEAALQDPHRLFDAAHVRAAAELLSRSALIEDACWHLRVPVVAKAFLTAVNLSHRCPGLFEQLAPAALSALAMTITGHAEAVSPLSAPVTPADAIKAMRSPPHGEAHDTTAALDPHPLEEKYGRRWLARWLVRRTGGGDFDAAWLVRLMVQPEAAGVAQLARMTLERAAGDKDVHAGLLRVLVEHLPKAVAAGRRGGGTCDSRSTDAVNYTCDGRVGGEAEAFFQLLATLLQPLWAKVLVAHRGFLSFVCRLIRRETDHLAALEGAIDKALGGDNYIAVELGWSLQKLLDLLSLFIETDDPDKGKSPETHAFPARTRGHLYFSRVLKAHDNGLALLMDASLTLKSLAAVRTRPVGAAEALLKGLLDVLSESTADKASFLTASVAYLARPRLPCRMGELILAQVLDVVDPKPPEVSCQLLLKKKPSQEDFIRGSMGNQPVASTAVGKTMADVASHICRHLDLQLDPDFGLELLVDSKIIDPSLPIQLVHDLVWREGSTSKAGGGAMVVVYRLQGLDGEATEERVDSLQQPEVVEDNPELKFAVTECLAEGAGLPTLLAYVSCLCSLIRMAEEEGNVATTTLEWTSLHHTLTLLHHCCNVRANRAALARHDALQIFLSAVDLCGNKPSDAAHAALQLLLSMAGCVAGELGETSRVDQDSGINSKHLDFCFTHLEHHYAANKQQFADISAKLSRHRIGCHGLPKAEHHLYDVLRLVTVLTYSNVQAVDRVYAHFLGPALSLTADESDTAVFHAQGPKHRPPTMTHAWSLAGRP